VARATKPKRFVVSARLAHGVKISAAVKALIVVPDRDLIAAIAAIHERSCELDCNEVVDVQVVYRRAAPRAV
jgi:hypothetical protein